MSPVFFKLPPGLPVTRWCLDPRDWARCALLRAQRAVPLAFAGTNSQTQVPGGPSPPSRRPRAARRPAPGHHSFARRARAF